MSENKKIVRSGDIRLMDLLDCPVFLLQQWTERYTEDAETPYGFWETTEGVWFTRKEAHDWAMAHHYRMGKWRVYSVGARGDLKTLLKEHTDYSVDDAA